MFSMSALTLSRAPAGPSSELPSSAALLRLTVTPVVREAPAVAVELVFDRPARARDAPNSAVHEYRCAVESHVVETRIELEVTGGRGRGRDVVIDRNPSRTEHHDLCREGAAVVGRNSR